MIEIDRNPRHPSLVWLLEDRGSPLGYPALAGRFLSPQKKKSKEKDSDKDKESSADAQESLDGDDTPSSSAADALPGTRVEEGGAPG